MTLTDGARGTARRSGFGAPLVAGLAIGILLLATTSRLISSGVLTYVGIPANVLGLEPLFGLIVDHRPIEELGPRSYGVVAMLLFDPIARSFGRDAVALNVWALFLGLASLATAFVLMSVRLEVRRPRSLAAMAILWTGFVPIVYALALRHFDLIVMAFVAAAFFFYTGTARRRPWSGASVAAGFLTKFLPLIFIPFFLARERRAFAYSLAAIAGLLLVGQVVYGTPVGLGYPYYVAGPTLGSIDDFSTWHEGFSPRQLLFKLAGGFHLQANSYVASPPNAQLWSYFAYGLALALLGYLLYVTYRYRAADGIERRSIEFGLCIATMYMVAPTVGHEHLPSLMLAYTILIWYWLRRPAARSRATIALAVASLVLTGVYVPTQIVGAVLPLNAIMRALGNEGTPIFGNTIGEYDFLGLPGYGVILAWVVFALLERRTRLAPLATSPHPATSDASRT